MQSHLADIDELVLRCRDDEARKYIAEAVASYKSGAFRACIVMTWIAVLYDFLYKLRELDLAGDKQAKAKLEAFEKARQKADYNYSLDFEKQVLDYAKNDFEFISESEYQDLCRLYEDRNRCAHPSMVSKDEVYKSSAELARTHLRHAVEYLLQYPPTQGQAYVDTLIKQTESIYFPTKVEKVVEIYRSRQIEKSKDAVIRNFATAMVKGLILADFDDDQIRRTSVALNALRQLKREIVESAIKKHLSDAIMKVDDENLYRVIRLLRNVHDIHEYLRDDARIIVENYIETVEEIDELATALDTTLDIPTLQKSALGRLNNLEREDASTVLGKLKKLRPELVELSLKVYGESESYADANWLGNRVIIRLIYDDYLIKTHLIQILVTANDNSQVGNSHELGSVLHAFVEKEIVSEAELKELLKPYPSVSRQVYEVLFNEEWDPHDYYNYLQQEEFYSNDDNDVNVDDVPF